MVERAVWKGRVNSLCHRFLSWWCIGSVRTLWKSQTSSTARRNGRHRIEREMREVAPRLRSGQASGEQSLQEPRAKARPLQRGAELACGEIFQGAEASVEFRRRQAPQAVERAQKIRDRTVALARVAFDAAGNQVAVGIASQAHAWHDVVEALHVGGSAAEAVKAGAAFAIVNGFAQRPGFQEIRGFEGRGRRLFRGLGGAIEEVASGE